MKRDYTLYFVLQSVKDSDRNAPEDVIDLWTGSALFAVVENTKYFPWMNKT